jgi:MFS family permease
MLFLLPFFLARGGSSPSATGRILLLFTISMVLASPVGGRLSDAIGARAISICGALLATLGAALFVTRGELVASVILMGAGIGMTSGPSNASALSAVPAAQAGVASGALSTMRYLGGVIGSGIVALLASGATPADPRLYVFPAVLFISALVALRLPGKAR